MKLTTKQYKHHLTQISLLILFFLQKKNIHLQIYIFQTMLLFEKIYIYISVYYISVILNIKSKVYIYIYIKI
jgi:hypothetical protein